MEILRFKTMKTIKLLGFFKQLSEVDKLRLTFHLLESKYLHLDIDKDIEKNTIFKKLMKIDNSYVATLINFNKYKYLTFLSAKFMEMSEYEKETLVLEMLDKL